MIKNIVTVFSDKSGQYFIENYFTFKCIPLFIQGDLKGKKSLTHCATIPKT